MSLQAARACIEKVSNNEAFRQLLEGAPSKRERYQIAQREGLVFTKEEWDLVVSEDKRAPQIFGSLGRANCYFPGECRA